MKDTDEESLSPFSPGIEEYRGLSHRMMYGDTKKKSPYPECDTFIYAAYLPPGLHQFIIYCPITKRVYCKDLIVDLSHADLYPEFPSNTKHPKNKRKITKRNVWR